jgi:hypothetical protein
LGYCVAITLSEHQKRKLNPFVTAAFASKAIKTAPKQNYTSPLLGLNFGNSCKN